MKGHYRSWLTVEKHVIVGGGVLEDLGYLPDDEFICFVEDGDLVIRLVRGEWSGPEWMKGDEQSV